MSFIVDLALKFFTGFVEGHEDRGVMQQSRVVRRYVRGFFVFDACAAVPFALLGGFDASPLRLLKMVKLWKASESFHFFQHLVEKGYCSRALLSLLELVWLYLVMMHMNACGYWRVAIVTEPDGWDDPGALERGFAPHASLRACEHDGWPGGVG